MMWVVFAHCYAYIAGITAEMAQNYRFLMAVR